MAEATLIKQFSLNELRGILSDEITKPAGVNAVSNASGKILSTYKLELEVAKILGKKPTSCFAGLIEDGSQ